ncbi:hypothetical protein CDL12_19349 [Handroanthus impetiginosus]|uniref:Stigma-specific protein Stig1 n=1 Tax=Handroanthus impetiginosus TaxID=429701 RepID=A0A2G9GSU4_9LAMI|nr:hypothetical protein CDL12_19349 [Handroanthus impetiginosus]
MPTNSQRPFRQREALATKRVTSPFLLQTIRNPRTANQNCNDDNQFCSPMSGGESKTCCNNKCVETESDSNNCGACGNKCAFTEVCCRGECVNLAYAKRHCGFCNNVCGVDGDCVYGICDYA